MKRIQTIKVGEILFLPILFLSATSTQAYGSSMLSTLDLNWYAISKQIGIPYQSIHSQNRIWRKRHP